MSVDLPDVEPVLPPVPETEAETAPPKELTPLFRGPRPDGMGFGENARGAWRSGTLVGALSEAADLAVMRGALAEAEPSAEGGGAIFNPRLKVAGRRADDATAQAAADLSNATRAEDAEAAFYEQVAYDVAPANLSARSIAGTLAGSMASPEAFGGLSSLLVRALPKLAARPIARTAADAALVNTLTDPAVQGVRLLSGGQDEYSLAQTAAAPVIGAAVGGTVAGAAVGASAFARRTADMLAERAGRTGEAPAIAARPDAAPAPGSQAAEPPLEITVNKAPEAEASPHVVEAEPMATAEAAPAAPPGSPDADAVVEAAPAASAAIEPPAAAPSAPEAPVVVKGQPVRRERRGQPLTLTQFIARNGGLALDGDARHADLHKVFVPGAGPLARKSGLPIDGFWRDALIEAGYLPRDADGYHSRDIRDELIEKLRDEQAGNKHYSVRDEARVQELGDARIDEENARFADEVEGYADKIAAAHEAENIPRGSLDERSLYDAAEALARGDEADPLDAYESAAIRRVLSEETGAKLAAETYDIPPGWEAPDEVQRGAARQDGRGAGSQGGGGEGSRPQDGPAGAGEKLPGAGARGPTERTAAGEQAVIPGAERIGQGELAQRRANQPLKPKAEQNLDTSGLALFGDGHKQADLLFRRKPPGSPPPDQIAHGRPAADQGTAAAPDAAVVRLEDLTRSLRESFGVTLREGRVEPGAKGQYSTKSGVARVKALDDLDTALHEVGHHFHLSTAAKGEIDRLVSAHAGELAALGAGQGKDGNAEAFAELLRLYALNRPFAERTYPQATAALADMLTTRHAPQARAIESIRAALDVLHRAPSQEVVTADTMTVQPPGLGGRIKAALSADYDPSGRKVYSFLDALYAGVVDRHHPIYKAVRGLVDIANANGATGPGGKVVEVLPLADAYVLKRLQSGAAGTADTMLRHGVIPAGGVSPHGPSLAGAIEKALPAGVTEAGFRDFGAYLVARRMVAEYARFLAGAIPNPPGKFSLADYEGAVAQFEARYPAFQAAAIDVHDFLRNHLTRQFEKGLWTREQYDAALAKQDYVPFAREQGDAALEGTVGASKSLKYSVVKAFRGSRRSVVNPIETIFKRIHDYEWLIEQNDVVNALARLAETAGPGAGAIAEPIPSHQMRAQRVDAIEALRAAGKQAGADAADLAHLIHAAEDMLGESTAATLFRPGEISEKGEPIVYHWVGGERRALRLADGRFGRELYAAMTAMGDVERNVLVTVLQAGQVALRIGVTKAPEFLFVNFVRDQLTAFGTAGRKYVPFVSALRGFVDVIRRTDEAVEFAGAGGLAGGAIVEMMESSGFGRNAKALAGPGLLAKIGTAFDMSEASTRLGLFRSYKRQAEAMGFDEANAVAYATFKANDYIDFRKFGAKMGWLRRIVPFLNAAIQGGDREFRALGDLAVLEAKRLRGETLSAQEADRLKDARIAFLRVAALGMMAGAGLAWMNADEPEYQSAPAYVKNNNFLVKVGDTWFAIPKPFGLIQTAVNAFERAADYAERKDPTIALEWLKGAGEALAPPIHNPIVALAYDLPANHNRFREREIVPYRLQGVEAKDQWTGYTSEVAKTIGAATGWSPMKIDYFLTNLGGGLARDSLFYSDLAMGSDRPAKQAYDWPILRRFVKNLARGNEATTAFHRLVGEKNGEYEKAENSYRSLIERGQRAEAERHLRGLDDDRRAWTVLNTQGFDAAAKRLHPMYSARERISAISGLIAQLNANNVLRIDDLDRRDLTRSRRDAAPIALNPSQRAKLIDELSELAMVTARNAMVDIGATGTAGLRPLDPAVQAERIAAISPELHAEYLARLKQKRAYDPAEVRKTWPETRRRLLADGENADLDDLLPAGAKRKRRRR